MIIAQQSSEMAIASYLTDPSTGGNRLMEIICERENIRRALQRVRSNKGAPGVDGMTVDQLPSYLRRHWPQIKEDLLNGTLEPSSYCTSFHERSKIFLITCLTC